MGGRTTLIYTIAIATTGRIIRFVLGHRQFECPLKCNSENEAYHRKGKNVEF